MSFMFKIITSLQHIYLYTMRNEPGSIGGQDLSSLNLSYKARFVNSIITLIFKKRYLKKLNSMYMFFNY